MNDLETYFLKNTGRLIHKWRHYFDIYERHFARFRGRPITLVEIGVFQGGSIQMWKSYFGPQARIVGVDIDPRCKAFEDDRVQILIGDQEDRSFLRSVAKAAGTIDILIDDGGHQAEQQVATFEELFAHVAANGVYVCEDLHTSYWKRFGGGYGKRRTFIEYSKRLIDSLNAEHSEQPRRLRADTFTRTANSMHFYDSVLVIEKQTKQPLEDLRSGSAQFNEAHPRRKRWRWLRRLAARR
jgi:hypothetical protein